MNFDALRDSLMDWAYEQAEGRFTEIVGVMPFAEAHGFDLATIFTLVRACRDMGLAHDRSTMGSAALQLTPAGISAVQGRRRRLEDPALRAAAARNGLLRWLYRQDVAGVHRAWPKQFADADEAMYEGSRLTPTEIDHAADYLAAKGLIEGTKAYGGRGLERAAITTDGMDCVTNWGGDVSAYLRGQQHAATTYNGPVIHGNADSAQLVWNNTGTVNQTQTHTEQVAPDLVALAQAVTDTLQRLPEIGLATPDRQHAEAAGKELLVEVVRDEPDHGRIRHVRATLLGYLAPIAFSAATGAGQGAQELARHAIERLSSAF